ncbi:chorismate--pyruvate lyase family protein [Niveibacterium terrae]|uniref:chorismate--pyruvate lyase family protein n=1 Tax=Niveibacterium terrae TaxID=3373598 RepID=UPI003A92CF53
MRGMSACTIRSPRDPWNALFAPLRCDGLAPWLRHEESLTDRISSRSSRFEVRVLSQRFAALLPDEVRLLGRTRIARVRVREVLLCADGRAVVFARSLVACGSGPWREWQDLGTRPLACLLFGDPMVSRTRLAFRRLGSGDPRVRAARAVSGAQGPLWARRRSFLRGGSPLLLTEVFLPAILELGS